MMTASISSGPARALASGYQGVVQAVFRSPGPIFPHAVQLHPGRFVLPSQGGRPLPLSVQTAMEQLFHVSFSNVRIHLGPAAASLGAQALTHGHHIHFASERFQPETPQGRRLIAHELTHVIQQRSGRVRNPFGQGIALIQDPVLEAEAERMGCQAAGLLQHPGSAVQARLAPHVQAAVSLSRGEPSLVSRTGALPARGTTLPHPIGPPAPHVQACLRATQPAQVRLAPHVQTAVQLSRGKPSPMPHVQACRKVIQTAQISTSKMTLKGAREQLSEDLQPVLDDWLRVRLHFRSSVTEQSANFLLGAFELEHLTRTLERFSERRRIESMETGTPPIADINEYLANSGSVGKYIKQRQGEGVSVSDVRILGEQPFQEVIGEALWDKIKGKAEKQEKYGIKTLMDAGKESSARTVIAFANAQSIDPTLGVTHRGTIYLRQGHVGEKGAETYVHEALHRYSDKRFKKTFGRVINEGFTEALARRVTGYQATQSFSPYTDEVSACLDVMEASGLDGEVWKAAYFFGDTSRVEERLKAFLGEDFEKLRVATQGTEVEAIVGKHTSQKSTI